MRLLVTLVTLGAAALTVRAASPVACVYPNPAHAIAVDGAMWLETEVKALGTGKVLRRGEGAVKALYGRHRNGFHTLYK